MQVWLYNNKLTTFDESAFSGLPRPLSLSVGKNPLMCDTNLCWLKQGYVTWLTFENRNLEPECSNGMTWGALNCQGQVQGRRINYTRRVARVKHGRNKD